MKGVLSVTNDLLPTEKEGIVEFNGFPVHPVKDSPTDKTVFPGTEDEEEPAVEDLPSMEDLDVLANHFFPISFNNNLFITLTEN